MTPKAERLRQLKEERNAVILAHNYQRPEIQDNADYLGDSLGLAKQASETDADVIVFCGVDFMAESAKILNPDKTVLLPDTGAQCPMAAMVDPERLQRVKEERDMDVVSYVNTTAAVKAVSDICCTSANAVKVVGSMPDGVIFVPDTNLGRWVQRHSGEREVILWPGFCPTHQGIEKADIMELKERHPDAKILAHPECTLEVLDIADSVESTSGMLRYAHASDAREFIIATEKELAYRMKQEMPDKTFYTLDVAICQTMKKITLDKTIASLETMQPAIELDPDIMEAARIPLQRMMELGR